MNLLWETDALLAATKGRPVGKMPEGVSGISIDTRTLQEGEAYFAIKGDLHDGHDFVGNAMRSGAALAVISQDKLVALGRLNIPMVVVSDVLEAMRQLGLAARARSKARIVAVTGSVGKTTTKEMLRTVLSASGKVHASAASFNNHWGVPLTLARMPVDTRFGIFEIGMNHPDEIRPLVKMVRPHVAMINNVAAAHLGAFNSIDDIAAAKAEIFEGVVSGGYGLINRDDARFKLQSELASACKLEHLLSFGEKKGADFRLKNLHETGDHSEFTAVLNGKEFPVVLNMPGRHLVQNALAVLGVAWLTGADIAKSVEALANVKTEKGRGQRHVLLKGRSKFTLIDESYNANPASMSAAIATLGNCEVSGRGRRIAVLGDMLELGNSSAKLHRELAVALKAANIDLVMTVGKEIVVLKEELESKKFAGHFDDWQAADKVLAKLLRADDVIVLKASNGLRFGNWIAALCEAYKPRASSKAGSQKPKEVSASVMNGDVTEV